MLGRLPLGALPGKEPGKYLLEEHTIALVPVPQLIPELVNEEGRKQLKKNLLLLGNVDYDAEPGKAAPASPASPGRFEPRPAEGVNHFDPLPGTQGEIATIEKLYRDDEFGQPGPCHGSSAIRPRSGPSWPRPPSTATCTWPRTASSPPRTAVRPWPRHRKGQAASARCSRATCSCQVSGLHPGLLSGLALAGANRAGTPAVADDPDADDGILTAEEIGSMNLEGVNLVMLSACETGLGKAAGGEGLLGLQRAFQSAGARTVVASLWKVDDDATRALMVEFYRNRWERRLSKLESLRQAQLKMMREYDPKSGQLRGPGPFNPVDPATLAAAPEAGGKLLAPSTGPPSSSAATGGR